MPKKTSKNKEAQTEVIKTTVKLNPERYPLLAKLYVKSPSTMAEIYRRLANQYVKDHNLQDFHPFEILDSCASLLDKAISTQSRLVEDEHDDDAPFNDALGEAMTPDQGDKK